MLPDCSGLACGCWSTVSSSRRHLHAASRRSLVDLRRASCVCLPLLGFQIIAPPSYPLVRSSPGSQTVTRLRAFGRAMPMTPRVPSSPFLTTSTVYSRSKLQACCILLPTMGSARFPETSSRDLPHAASRMLFSRLTAPCRSPKLFQQIWCIASRLSLSSRTPPPFEAFPVHAVACSVTCDALTSVK